MPCNDDVYKNGHTLSLPVMFLLGYHPHFLIVSLHARTNGEALLFDN